MERAHGVPDRKLKIRRNDLHQAEAQSPNNLQRRLRTAARVPEGENLNCVVVDVQTVVEIVPNPGKMHSSNVLEFVLRSDRR
jgi:hypothetical protein